VVCTEEQKRDIFEDFKELNSGNSRQVEGWSFVGAELEPARRRQKSPFQPPNNSNQI
jgi:hypothetical protein